MTKTLLAYFGRFTVFSLILIEITIAYPLLVSNEMSTLSEIMDSWTIFSIVFFLIVVDFFIDAILNEFYESVTSFLFRKQMLEYTYVKKSFKNGFYEVAGKPNKSYDNLPQEIQDSINKLDILYHNQKMPHFFDLTVAFTNSITFSTIGFLQNNNQYLLLWSLMSLFFILLLAKAYFDIGMMITIDYKSIFEE